MVSALNIWGLYILNRRDFSTAAGMVLGSLVLPKGITAQADPPTAKVVVDASASIGDLPAFGLGFSMEKHLIGVGDQFTARNTDLAGCCRRLGPQIFRLGGNHVDTTSWNANGPGGVNGQTSPSDIKQFADFVRSVGWKVIYGLNLATSQPAATAAEGKTAADALGDSLVAFEIGNEPDLFAAHGFRPRGYSVEAFMAEWMQHAKALRAAVPQVRLSGPGATKGGWQSFALPFGATLRGSLTLLTQHYYGGNGTRPGATLDALLDGMPELFEITSALVQAAKRDGISGGFRLVEMNTFGQGGSPGVSDRMISALWAVQYVLRAAELGANGVNFQIGPSTHSNSFIAIASNRIEAVRPGFYGLAFLSDLGTGAIVKTQATGLSPRQSAFAIRHADGKVSVVLNNMSNNALSVQVLLEGAGNNAKTCLLTAPGLLANSEVTLCGATIAVNGTGKAAWTSITAASARAYDLRVPPASAMRVTTA